MGQIYGIYFHVARPVYGGMEFISVSLVLFTAHGGLMDTWYQRVNRLLARRGWSQAELARRANEDEQRLYKWLQGRVAQPRGDAILRLAKALGVSPIWLQHGVGSVYSTLPVVGYVSAGEAWVPFSDHAVGNGYDEVSFTLEEDEDLIAIEVRGTSMSPVYRPGDRIICNRQSGNNIHAALGRDCVVLTASGDGYLKRLARGTQPGSFTLRSYNPDFPDLEDVQVDWVAPVAWIKRGS